MSNYTKDNLLTISKEDVPVGSLAIKVGDEVFPLSIQGGGIDTSDATATAVDILAPKTAYVDGKLVTGEITNYGDITDVLSYGEVLNLSSGFYESVSITAPTAPSISTEDLIINPNKDTQVFDDASIYYDKVTVNPIPDEYSITSDGNAQPSDVAAGKIFYNASGRQEGTAIKGDVSESSGATVNANVVTVGKGYLAEDLIVTIPVGSVSVNTGANKVVVTKGYVASQEIPLTGGGGGGFELVKVTNYHPAREGFTAPGTVTFSGLGITESEWGGDPADFSDVNGDYVVTEDTKYRKGLARVYKQRGGKYYLCGYDPSGMDWAEYSAHWYVSETVGGYGWSAKMSLYNSSELHTGTVNWSSDMIGEFPVTTTVAMRDYSALTETSLAQSVTAFDPETADWTEGDAVDISSYSITPQTNGIYFAQGGKLIGQHIDRELKIPEDGLVRRFKTVDGHFADKVWGTEMKPSGDISFDELGYCGNRAAPMSVKTGSYLSCPNTLYVPKNYTVNVFFKPYYSAGTSAIFEINNEGSDQNSYFFGIWLTSGIAVQCVSFYQNIGSAQPVTPGKWHCVTMTVSWSSEIASLDGNERVKEFTVKMYVDGKLSIDYNHQYDNSSGAYAGMTLDYITGNTVRAFARMHSTSESFIGQIDEACIWDRILTDEEIADMANGLEGFDWDIPVNPYVNKKPLMYASLSEQSDLSDSGQQLAYTGSVSFVTSSDRQCARIEGKNNFIHVKPAAGNGNAADGWYSIQNKFSLAAWIRATDPENNSAFITFSGGGPGPRGNEVWLICGKTVSLTDGAAEYALVSTNIDGSAWRHVTCVWDGVQFTLYVDGAYQGSYTGTGHMFDYPLYLYINSLQRAPQAVTGCGEYADVFLYDRVLAPEEISELYNRTLV